MNLFIKTRNFCIKITQKRGVFVLKTKHFVFKMMNLAGLEVLAGIALRQRHPTDPGDHFCAGGAGSDQPRECSPDRRGSAQPAGGGSGCRTPQGATADIDGWREVG